MTTKRLIFDFVLKHAMDVIQRLKLLIELVNIKSEQKLFYNFNPSFLFFIPNKLIYFLLSFYCTLEQEQHERTTIKALSPCFY